MVTLQTLNTLSHKNLTMKSLLVLAALAASLVVAITSAQDQKTAAEKTRRIDVIGCTIRSSAPPLSSDMANKHPTVLVDNAPINGSNNNWVSLADRVQNPMIGGWGDLVHYCFRWELKQDEKISKQVYLRFDLQLSPEHNAPEKVELRLITGGDNNPIRNEAWDPARLHWSLAPSSEHFVTLPYQEGTNEVDITSAIKEWVKRPERCLGFVMAPTTNGKVSVRISNLTLRFVK
jgi:hypothetical protein